MNGWIKAQIDGTPTSNRSDLQGNELFTIALLLLGGVVIPVFGWIIGVITLWRNRQWSKKDKWIGTLLLPLGFLPFTLLLAAPLFSSRCVVASHIVTNAQIRSCASATFSYSVLDLVLLIILVVLPLIGSLHLVRARAAK